MRILANGVMPTNKPLLAMVGAYIELVNSIRTLRVTPGIYKLFLMQSGGVAIAPSALDGYASTLQADDTGRLINTDYVNGLICLNISAYIEVLTTCIKYRIAELSSRGPTPGTSAINTTRARRSHYWPSGPSIKKMELFGAASAPSQTSYIIDWLRDVEFSLKHDVDYVVGMGGMDSPHSPSPYAILTFLKQVGTIKMWSTPTTSFRDILLPILSILHNIARLLWGSVDQDEWESRTSMLPAELVKFKLSDITLACIPSPNVELITSFVEPTEAALSTRARQFLDKLTVFYITSDDVID